MHSNSSVHPKAIKDLVDFLFNRRETVLNNWRSACEADTSLKKIAILSREEFNNLMPIMFDILEQQLLGEKPLVEPATAARAHGLHRWQKSLGLPELLKELHHLSTELFNELRLYRQLFPQSDPDLVLRAQQQIMALMNDIVSGSISKHDELQRLQAADRAASLEEALQEMYDLSRLRGDMLRTSSHDLRSGLGLSIGAASLLQLDGLSQEDRKQYSDMLNRNLAHVESMLTSLMDLARLEAGQEPIHLEDFDAAQLLNELVANAQPKAVERGVILRADGPDSLPVKTDRIKIYRIVQNLLVNALLHTPSSKDEPGMVSVSWSAENDWRWGFSVQDSGPGMPTKLMEYFHQQFRPIVEETSVLSPDEGQPVSTIPNEDHQIPAGPLLGEPGPGAEEKGEGVGLQIVKRLCELIGASMELESIEGRGTLFRIRMSMRTPDN
ncbi:sensor histidine kinase [Fibrella forsythiae]|uniref:histidine kinase n=1 Tax=Fibrella forsythiae TaxID=2817061 RepID=A0ABS3JG48_9BACT|nr:HAMP domain-containing sensor histidine kinase [Fibrella forsythiae]MBO0948975.1 HAMP domain-containing histidine kinase [Fibrella forsythiae]